MDVTKILTTDLPAVVGLVEDGNNILWIHNPQEKILQKVKVNDEIDLIQELNGVKVYDITKLVNDEGYLLSIYSNHTLTMLTTKGQLKPLSNISPFLPLGIHITKENDILVGFQENAPTFPITETSRRGIKKLGMDRKVKFNFEYDKDKRRLFTCPYRITTNINGDICVADIITADNSGRVAVLGYDGSVKWSYIGNPEVNGGWNKFNPEGIATTSQGHIVITDCNNHAIHVLSMEGNLILCQKTMQLNFIAPCSVCMGENDTLKIGCSSTKGKSEAQIVFLKLNIETY
ncbi:unnamed protein product [Mytilus coruscus]|uniref:TRIM2_3 n=1 Tax=Mytilus coruscus TaxID=42192 RepID=A0A6J8C5N7_MYTCO|nr:unnamed protein product [Mytilus coruscus]